jgi:hypothetical protein
MITDRIQLAGSDAYFKDPASGKINLGGVTPTIRTSPLNKGKQLEISGIQLLIEHQDLQPLLTYPSDNAGLPVSSPLFKISVTKEMFAGLFADPFSHRVYNIAGFLDFNEGTLVNGRIMEVDGVPTICSTSKEECVWTSKEYIMPDPISIDAIAWELATAKFSPPDSFHYKIKITSKDSAGAALPDINIDNGGQMLKADAKRAIEGLSNQNIQSFQIRFEAKVFEDSYVRERSAPLINENIGRPLLRAINILEPVKSVYEFQSISELQSHCSDFHLFDVPGPAIKRLTALLDLSAVLTNSPNQVIANNDIYNASSKYENVELKLFSNQFTRFDAKLDSDIIIKNL